MITTLSLRTVLSTLEDISLNRNAPEDGNWNQTTRDNAITFSFIVTLVVVRYILGLTRPPTVKLQRKAIALLKAKDEIILLELTLTRMQTNIEARHHQLYDEAVIPAKRVSFQPLACPG